ncbi:MAG: hypothetical protein WDM80_15150 [Limisphaerales bacterium]
MPTTELLVQPDRAFLNHESPPTSSPAASYFQTSCDVFEQATRSNVLSDCHYRIGGCSLRLRFASESLLPLVIPALAHLQIEPSAQPDLTICLGDLAALDANLKFPGDGEDDEPEGALWRHEDARFFMLAQKETDSLSLLDAVGKIAFYWTRDAARLPWYENSFPLRHLLAHFFRRHDRHMVHAAAVGDENGAVLIVGRGGSGKSTATLACAMNGLFYLGDDYTLASIEPEPRVWSLYSSAKMNADSLNWFPRLKSSVHHSGGVNEKSSLFLNGAREVSFAESRPIRAVLWPRITGRAETRLTPASPMTLLLALAPSSILQTPGGGDSVLRALGRLVKSVPTCILEAGNDPAQIASAIKKFLSR